MKKVSIYILILTGLISMISSVILADEYTSPAMDEMTTLSNGAAWTISETVKDQTDLRYDNSFKIDAQNHHRRGGPGGPGRPGDHRRPRPIGSRDALVLLIAALAIIVAAGGDNSY
jgi:hypothetical protein